MTKFKLTTKVLKKAGKELEEILEPTDNDGIAISIGSGNAKEMKAKIIEAGEALTPEDDLSDHLNNVLKELGIEITDEEKEDDLDEPEKEKEKEDIKSKDHISWEDLENMKKKELEELVKDHKLISEADDYDTVKDFRIAIADELNIKVPGDNIEEVEITNEDMDEIEEENDNEMEDGEIVEEEDLLELVNNTKKLAELKGLVENYADFKKLRKGLDKFTGISGVKGLKAKMLGVCGDNMEEKEKAIAPEVKKDTVKPKKEKGTPSNKEAVYLAWKKDLETTVDSLLELIENRVKKNTIKAWLNQWKNSKNLPACAKKE